jgi:hypothetical protein
MFMMLMLFAWFGEKDESSSGESGSESIYRPIQAG